MVYCNKAVFSFLFILSLSMYIKTTRHFLTMLLTVEFLVLIIFAFLNLNSLCLMEDLYSNLYFLSLAVCEGALGLALIVSYTRTKGKDLLISL